MTRKMLDFRGRWPGLLIVMILCFPGALFAQHPLKVKGTVINESTREVLTGVTVTVKGSTIATTTNEKGEYTINATEKDVLVFSNVGYQPMEMPVTKGTMNVRLSNAAKSLDDVVVVGYGTQSKRNVTGSISTVNVKSLEELPVTNIAQALRGKVAGVQFNDNARPGQTGTILIRGQRSISASNDPLIVLDGIIFEGNLNDINPGDIQSMDVLKDASSTAIYGSRAANGVILVTSKKGTSEQPTIRFSSYYAGSNWSHTPKLLSPARYIQRLLDYRTQSNLTADPNDVADYLTPTEAKNYKAGQTIDPWKVVSQSANIQNYDLNVSGHSGKTNYFFSGNYNYDKGLIFNDNSKRIGVRVNISNQIRDWLKVGVNAQFTNRDMSGNESDVLTAFRTSPFASPWLDAAHTDPNPFPTEDNLIGSINFNSMINRNQEFQENLFSNFFAIVDFPFVPGLSYRINYSPNYRWYTLNNFDPIYQKNGLNDLGFASREKATDEAWVMENILTYTKKLGKYHDFDVTLLYGRNGSKTDTLLSSGADFTGTGDADGWDNLALAKIQTAASSASVINAISTMARINYRFKSRYMVTLTARRDGSSVFGANHKFGTFPSAALAWVASSESFLKSVSAIRMLKFRASYGSVGNQAIQPYQSLTRLGAVQYVYGDGGSTSVGLYPANLPNPNLTWETTTSANFGADFDLFRGRIGGTVEVYNMNTKNLLLTRQLPSPTGFSNILTNVGATNNKGVELTLNTINIKSGQFEWSSNFVFSTNKNKIVHLYHSDANGDGKEDDDISNSWFIGKPISVAYDYKVAGVYQVGDNIPVGQQPGFFRMTDINHDGKIDANDREVLGTLQPKYRYGFTNNVTYGNFNLMITLSAMTGWIANNLRLTLDDATHGDGTYPGRENFLDDGWWTAANKSNTRSSLVYTNPYNHGYYQSRDFLRLQEVALSYEFPKRMIDRLRIINLKAYVSGRNLGTLTKWQGMDPESGTSLFPMARTISGGFNISF